MPTFIMLTRLSPDALQSPGSFEEIEQRVMEKIRAECPDVEWVHNFAVLGGYDYVDIFRASNEETAFKVAAIIRSFGHCTTEIWAATEWKRFREMIHEFKEAA